MALLLVALASSGATAGDAPGVDGQSSPPKCTAVPGSSGYMRCVYGGARPSVAAAPTRSAHADRTASQRGRGQVASERCGGSHRRGANDCRRSRSPVSSCARRRASPLGPRRSKFLWMIGECYRVRGLKLGEARARSLQVGLARHGAESIIAAEGSIPPATARCRAIAP
jgi:hypothetical protein